MDGATGTALEWALALLRAPTERRRLRQMPLPEGIGELLTIAANVAPDALAAAASRLGEPAATLLEAARFYAREVLFHEGADAYRTLGVDAQAGHDRIKAHHRLLQLWLHPDRDQSGDDSVFAARVNTAWNQLSSESRRRAYDTELIRAASAVPQSWPPVAPVAAPPRVWHPAAEAGPPVQPPRNRQRALVIGLLGVCLMLGWLAVRKGERVPEPWQSAADHGQTGDKEQPAQTPQARSASAGTDRADADSGRTRQRTAVEAQGRPGSRESMARVGEVAPMPALQRSPVATHPPAAVIQREVPVAAAPRPARVPLPAVADAGKREAAPVAPAVEAASAAPAVASAPVARRVRGEEEEAPAVAASGTSRPATERNDDRLLARLRRAFGGRDEGREARALDVQGTVTFDHIQQAREVGQQLRRFMGSAQRTPPPIWNSAAILDHALELRRQLQRDGAARLGAPQWRIGDQRAQMSMEYRIDGVVRGSVNAAIVWRDERWLVAAVDVESGQ